MYLLVSFALCCVTWFGAQGHDGAVDEVGPVVGVETLGLRDLDFVCAALQDALVVGSDGVFESSSPVMHRFKGFDQAVCGEEGVVCTLSAICRTSSAQSLMVKG